MIQVKRECESATKEDGARYFVERLWPRGIKKENLELKDGLKDIAPSTDLQRRFNHDPDKWDTAWLLFDPALVMQGVPLQHPSVAVSVEIAVEWIAFFKKTIRPSSRIRRTTANRVDICFTVPNPFGPVLF
jgi:hypothetical protein